MAGKRDTTKKKIKRTFKKGAIGLSGLLCFFMVVSMIYLMLCGPFYYLLSPAGMEKELMQTEGMQEKYEEFFSYAFYLDDISEYADEKEMQECNDLFFNSYQDMMHYYMTGSGTPFDLEEGMAFVKSHKSLFEKCYGYELEKEDLQYIREDLTYYQEELAEELAFDPEYLDDEELLVRRYLQFFGNPMNYLVPAGIILLGVLLMVLLFKGNQDMTLVRVSVTMIISAVVVAGGAVAGAVFLPDAFLDDEVIELLLLGVGKLYYIAGAVLAAGIILQAAGQVLRSQIRKKLAAEDNAGDEPV